MASLLYLASPALPVGAFAFSQGLSPACTNGFVDDVASLSRWLKTLLHYGLKNHDIPVLLRCRDAAKNDDATSFFYWNSVLFAGRESAELWFEEEQTGRALCRLLREQGFMPAWMKQRDCGYVAAFALAAVRLARPEKADAATHEFAHDTACAYAWAWLENQITAACKCLTLGQNAAQRILLDFMADVPDIVTEAAKLPDGDIGACLPGLAIASSKHELQYSRMFRS